MADSWKGRFWRNLRSTYMATAIRLGTGLILFPILFRSLSRAEFGFWSLLWSIVTYTTLMDFGIGSTARIEVARRAGREDWKELNGMLATMFWSYVGLFTAIEAVVLVARPWVLAAIDAQNNAAFSNAYVMFTIAIALSVPLGLLYEILRGLQRMDIVCAWWSRGQVLNLVLVSLSVYFHLGFETLVLASVIGTLLPLLGVGVELHRLVPDLSLHPRLFDLEKLRPVARFSGVAYLLSVANLVIARSDQIVIGVCLGVSSVAIYQAGFKVADLYAFGLLQLSEQLSPAAAQSSRNPRELSDLMLKSTRITALMSAPLFVLALIYIDPLIHLLTGLSPIPPEYRTVGIVLLIARFSSLLTHSCACPIFLGAGYERKLLRFTLAEAGLNLGVSIVLAMKFGVVGVALGTLVPAVMIGWLWAVPLASQFAEHRLSHWLRKAYAPVLVPVTMSMTIALVGALLWPAVTREAVAAAPPAPAEISATSQMGPPAPEMGPPAPEMGPPALVSHGAPPPPRRDSPTGTVAQAAHPRPVPGPAAARRAGVTILPGGYEYIGTPPPGRLYYGTGTSLRVVTIGADGQVVGAAPSTRTAARPAAPRHANYSIAWNAQAQRRDAPPLIAGVPPPAASAAPPAAVSVPPAAVSVPPAAVSVPPAAVDGVTSREVWHLGSMIAVGLLSLIPIGLSLGTHLRRGLWTVPHEPPAVVPPPSPEPATSCA